MTTAPPDPRLDATGASDTDGLDRFYRQQPDWAPAEDAALAGLDLAALTVPLDYRQPAGETITVTIGRHPATDPASRIGVLLIGPGDDLGNPGLPLAAQLVRALPEVLVRRFDVVGFDHRFMGRSTPRTIGLTPEERFWVFHQPRSFAEEVRFQAGVAAKCAELAPDILPHATSRNIARDMDVIRGVLGEEKLAYLGYSYGTYLGAVYAQMFGAHAGPTVLDSICSPDWVWRGLFTDFPPNGELGLDRWARWAARRDEDWHLGTTAAEVRAGYAGLLARADRGESVTINGFPLDRTLVRLIAVGMLNSDRNYGYLADIVGAAAQDRFLRPATLTFVGAMFGEPKEESGTVAQLAILAGDRAWPRDLDRYEREAVAAALTHPFTGAAMCGVKAPAFWPVLPSEPATELGPDNAAESILMVAAAQDVSTPLAAAQRMHEVLAHNSRLVTVADTAHHRVFPFYGNAELDELVTGYLLGGRLPETDLTIANPDPQV
jgi:pimeloyl-ACP methyl ester carboxylesterase